MRTSVEVLDTLAFRGRRTRVFVALLLLFCPSTARAWKVTTHMILAERAAASLDDPSPIFSILKSEIPRWLRCKCAGGSGQAEVLPPGVTHVTRQFAGSQCHMDNPESRKLR